MTNAHQVINERIDEIQMYHTMEETWTKLEILNELGSLLRRIK